MPYLQIPRTQVSDLIFEDFPLPQKTRPGTFHKKKGWNPRAASTKKHHFVTLF